MACHHRQVPELFDAYCSIYGTVAVAEPARQLVGPAGQGRAAVPLTANGVLSAASDEAASARSVLGPRHSSAHAPGGTCTLAERTGKGIRIAVIDSGVHAAHPHVGGVSGGIAIREDGSIVDDVRRSARPRHRRDRGHPREGAGRRHFRDQGVLAVARDQCRDAGARHRGSRRSGRGRDQPQPRHRRHARIARCWRRRSRRLARAARSSSPPTTMGACAGCRAVWTMWSRVRADWTCARDTYSIAAVEDRAVLATSPYPRDIPGSPARAQPQRRELRGGERHRVRGAGARRARRARHLAACSPCSRAPASQQAPA